ncbi:MAG: ABC transporter ATP-binding protein [Bacteroides sp.]|nr:ABC transporter ATP-binding protein [Bacteroides sp.]MCM1448389.1 ABC transporter ATP-binding protein [Bacteroides sp.]
MIRLQNFSIGYGPHILFDKTSTSFSKGELTALIGRNGTGKSTMLRAIAGLNRRYTGEILLDGKLLATMPRPEQARKLAFVNTERMRIHNLVCEDVVAIGRAPYTDWIGRMRQADREIVTAAIRSVGMESYARRTMDTMSDGECQRIMIARALAQDTPIILLDEPTSFLDMPNRYELVSLLRSLAHKQGKCILFSTHELDVALRMCDSIALVDNGMLHHLPVPEMLASGHIQRLFHTPDLAIDKLCDSFITDNL